MNETGYINCKDLINRYNNDPRIIARNLTLHEEVLPPDTLKFKISVNNETGNFSGDLSLVFDSLVV